MDIPVFWLFKGQRPVPLLYRIAHIFPVSWISHRWTVVVGLAAIPLESYVFWWIIHTYQQPGMTFLSKGTVVLTFAFAGAILQGVARRFDRDIERRRLVFRYAGAQFVGLMGYGLLLISPISIVVPIALNAYVQLKHFIPKWHPSTAAEARRYAADLEKVHGKEIDFIKDIFVPITPRQWWAYIHLMNVPVSILLDELERLDRNSRDYKLTSIALTLNYRLGDVHLLQERYDAWIKRGDAEKARRDLPAWKLGMLYAGLPQKQIAAGDVRSPVVNKRSFRGRYPELLELLMRWLKKFRRKKITENPQVLEYGMSDGSFAMDVMESPLGEVPGVNLEATDNVMTFSVVEGLYAHGRYAGYTFIFKSDGQLMQMLPPAGEGRTWIRWMLTIYIPPLLKILMNGKRKTWTHRIILFALPPLSRVILDYAISFMTGIELGEWRMPVYDIEERWRPINGVIQNGGPFPQNLKVRLVSTVRPDLAEYEKACQSDSTKNPSLTTRSADVFEDPQKRPAKSKHFIYVNGLLMRNKEYFGAEKIKNALGEMGRLLVDGGILVNATRGSVYFPKKLYMDVYRRIGDSLVLIKTQGYEPNAVETWLSEDPWRTENWKRIPVANDSFKNHTVRASGPSARSA